MTPAFRRTIPRFARLTKTAATAAAANTRIVNAFAVRGEILPEGSGRSGWLIRSDSTSNRSFIAFPPAVNRAAARAARPIESGAEPHTARPPAATVPMRTPAADMRQFKGLERARSPRILVGQSLGRIIRLSRSRRVEVWAFVVSILASPGFPACWRRTVRDARADYQP